MLSSFVVHIDHLLRDRKFTILSDHKNLTSIKQAANPMIVRWHLALQELDFNIEFVPGVDNVIADAMSRYCTNNKPVIQTVVLAAIDGPAVRYKKRKLYKNRIRTQLNGWSWWS